MSALEQLILHCRTLGRTLLGYSGGVDSAVLAVCSTRAHRPGDFLAVIGRSPSYPAAQYQAAVALAAVHGVPVLEIETDELDNPAYRRNSPDRCYHCKQELWSALGRVAAARDFTTIIDGTNADDLGEHRPGLRAGRMAGIRSPLAELGFSKQAVRSLARELGLSVWDAPAAPCLSSRVEYGIAVTPERLQQVEQAEALLRALGVQGNLRVRHRGHRATVEVDPEWIPWVSARWHEIEPRLRAWGFAVTSLDPRGYRRGALAAELPVMPG